MYCRILITLDRICFSMFLEPLRFYLWRKVIDWSNLPSYLVYKQLQKCDVFIKNQNYTISLQLIFYNHYINEVKFSE